MKLTDEMVEILLAAFAVGVVLGVAAFMVWCVH